MKRHTQKAIPIIFTATLLLILLHIKDPDVVKASAQLTAFAYRKTVNIYSNPHYRHTGRTLKKLSGGQKISITPINKSWNRVNFLINGHYGYVHSNDILKDESTGSYHVYSLRKQTNIYNTPYPYGKKNTVFYSIRGSQSLTVVRMDRNWYKTIVPVMGKHDTGYVHHNDLNLAVAQKNNHYYASKSASNVYADAYSGVRSIIARIPRGHVLYGHSFSGNWNTVTINGRTGFIHNADFYKNNSFHRNFLIAFGDSVTRGSSADIDNGTTQYSWVHYLPSELGLSRVENYGVSGSAVAVRSDRKDSFQERESWINSHGKHPDTILVIVSINDFRHDVPLGSFDVRSRYTFFGGLRNFSEYLQRNNPKAKIIYMTPLTQNAVPTYSTYEKNELGLSQDQYAAAIKRTASYYGLELIDMQHDRFVNTQMNPFDPVIKKQYYTDGLHMNKAGYFLLSKEIARRLLNN